MFRSVTVRIPPRIQGDCGEFSAIGWLIAQGAKVYMPFEHSPDVDLVADFCDGLVRVQVKTSTVFRNGRWQVTLATRGGNQSWSGLVKNFCQTRCDYLFVHTGDGRRWFVPSVVVEGGAGIALGGPKYAEFEVDPGERLEVLAAPRVATLADPRRGSRAVKGAWL
ncbi:MAG: endonuclease [Solirubrobacteraceae bacterium]|nr:endonuclease [Solirubrobacteraceae bacterium]